MYINMSYINICRLNKNREWRKEWEREVSGDDVCDCSLGELLDNNKALPQFAIDMYLQKYSSFHDCLNSTLRYN